MERESRLKDAVAELRAERMAHQRKIEELDTLIRALEQRIGTKNGSLSNTVVMHGEEFAGVDILHGAIRLIERAGRPLHVKDITEALKAGGYAFRHPERAVRSVGSVLWVASKKKKPSVLLIGRNTFTTEKVGVARQ